MAPELGGLIGGFTPPMNILMLMTLPESLKKPIKYLSALFIACFLASCSGQSSEESPHPLEGTLIDIHAHANITNSEATADDLLADFDISNVGLGVFMVTPNAYPGASPETSLDYVAFFAGHTDRARIFYGGDELNPILHGLGRSEAFTVANVFPNGTGGLDVTSGLQELTDMALAPDTWTTEFQARATAAAVSGLYAGFGEFAAYHGSERSGHPFIHFKLDQELMLWLSDLAATHQMAIDVHMEATSEKLAELQTLLGHNRNTKIIWEHAGWSNTGEATADVLLALVAGNPNLYLGIKLRTPDSAEMDATYPFDESGSLTAAWQELLEGYADRIMIGTDAKYWQTSGGTTVTPGAALPPLLTSPQALLDAISAESSAWIQSKTAIEVLGL